MNQRIRETERRMHELRRELADLRRDQPGTPVEDHTFRTLAGDVRLSQMFGTKEHLFIIHNMGQGCRYCTLWADGINAFLPHLENEAAVWLVSKDEPETQRRFANERGWRFNMASHGGAGFVIEESVVEGERNHPGISCYLIEDGTVMKRNDAVFGPGDEFCSFWNIISLAGRDEGDWLPQFDYWKRPETLDDGGRNVD